MATSLTSSIPGFLLVPTGAAVMVGALALAARGGQLRLWFVAAIIAAAAYVAQRGLPTGMRLSANYCGDLCGSSPFLRPPSVALVAIGVAAVLSVFHQWAPRLALGFAALLVGVWLLLDGAHNWVA